MRDTLACIFHIHTSHSFDCVTSPAKTLKWAQSHHIDVLGITDHNTIRGAQEVAAGASKSGVQVIIGAEYETNQGDVIGLFLTEEIRSRDAFEVIEAIKAQGGISMLPHPYHGHNQIELLAKAVDIVEVFNARCSESQNHRAVELATLHNKPMLGGADAHFLRDIQNCICHFETGPMMTAESLLHAPRVWVGKRNPRSRLHLSQAIKGWKTSDPALVKGQLRAVLFSYIRAAVGENVWGKLRSAWRQGS